MERAFERILKVDQRNIVVIKFSTYEHNNWVALYLKNQVSGRFFRTLCTRQQLLELAREIQEELS